MNSSEKAIAIKALKEENATLKVLLHELEDAARYKCEGELFESVKAKLIVWVKWIVGTFVVAFAILGITTFAGARDAAISFFQKVSEPEIRRGVKEEIIPKLLLELKTEASRALEASTSASSKQFDGQMNELLGELKDFARKNKLNEPVIPNLSDAKNRPKKGYVLKSFLTQSDGEIYLINTYRLNFRDAPNGKVIGRQVQGALVKIMKEIPENGEWVEVEVQPNQ